MTLEQAMSEKASDEAGTLYGNIPTEQLAIMSNAITKKLKSANPGTPDEIATRQRKHQAIGIILASREAKQ
ncbi:hypothetical protein CCP3SC15_4450001 [Gammaproteobacteria bacterium]